MNTQKSRGEEYAGGFMPDLSQDEKVNSVEIAEKQIKALKKELDNKLGKDTYQIDNAGHINVIKARIDSELIEAILNEIEPQLTSWYAEKERLKKSGIF